MGPSTHFDLAVTSTYDLQPDFQGGLSLAYDIALDFQDLNFRCLTNNPDYALGPVGANLEDLAGKPNSQGTAQVGTTNLYRALTYDGRFGTSAVTVSAVPLSLNAVQFDISLNNNPLVYTTTPFYAIVQSVNG